MPEKTRGELVQMIRNDPEYRRVIVGDRAKGILPAINPEAIIALLKEKKTLPDEAWALIGEEKVMEIAERFVHNLNYGCIQHYVMTYREQAKVSRKTPAELHAFAIHFAVVLMFKYYESNFQAIASRKPREVFWDAKNGVCRAIWHELDYEYKKRKK